MLIGAALSLLGTCYFYVTISAATGYETSPVTPYPVAHWLLFIFVLVGTTIVFVGDAANPTGYWRYALPLLLSNYGLFVFLPEFREYSLYGRGLSDALPHLGYVKGILNTGTLPIVDGEVLWYPITHLLSAELALLGIPLSTTKYMLSFVFITLYILGIALALTVLLESRRAKLVGLAIATPLLLGPFHIGMYPHLFSFCLFPVTLACLKRYRLEKTRSNLGILLALSLLIVYFHPVTLSLLIVMLAVSASVTSATVRWMYKSTFRLRHTISLALVFIGLSWYTDFNRTSWKVQSVLRSLAGQSRAPAAVEVSTAETTVLTVQELLVRFVQLYGMTILYLLTGALISLILLREAYEHNAEYAELLLLAQFGVGLLLAAAFLGIDFLANNPVRVTRYLVLFATLMAGVGLVRSLDGSWSTSQVISVLLIFVIITTAILGAGRLYKPNKHMTHTEYDGTEFVLENYDGETDIWSYKGDKDMQPYVLGANHPRAFPEDITGSPSGRFYHLGYDENRTAARSFGNSYLVTKTHDRRFHAARYFFPAQRNTLFLYNKTHVRTLRDDQTAQKFYDNGGFEAWRIENTSERNSTN